MKAVLLCMLAWAAAMAAEPTYRIAGVVIDGATNRPAARIRVGLAPSERRDQERAVVTGADGAFAFDSLPKGKYSLTADHPNGIREFYGRPEMAPPGYGVAIVTGPDLKSDGLVFRLFPPAAIHGRITDQGGEPVENVLVQLYRVMVTRGSRNGYYYGSYRTNDIGEYRFGPLPAGTYYLLATGRPWYTEELKNQTETKDLPMARVGYAPVFYPNARDVRGASPVRVRAGQDAAADFIMTVLPAGILNISVKGPGESGEGDRRGGQASRLDITFEGPAGTKGWERVEWISASGRYTGIPQGRYTVTVSRTNATPALYGRTEAIVTGGETSVEVALGPALTVTGALRLAGESTQIPPNAMIELENEGENRHIRRAIEADGSFTFDNLPPGQYTPLLGSTSRPVRVMGVTVDGKESARTAIDILRPLRLDVTAVAKAYEVTGYVYRNGEPLPGVDVLLVPKRERLGPYDIFAFETDSDGSFEFQGVVEGEYLALPVEDFAEVEYANPETLKRYLPLGREVSVGGAQKSQSVRLELR